jgi:FG-GAP-like repeat/FG-GAP repeat
VKINIISKIWRKGKDLQDSLFFFLAILAISTVPASGAQTIPFNGPRDYVVGSYPQSVVVGDFNGDGRPDIATANQQSNNISVLLQNSDGTFEAAVNYAVGSGPVSLQIGDVNGDGKQDLVVINLADSTLAVLLGNGDGTFQAQKLTTLPGPPLPYMAVGDFNGDGKADVAIAEPLPQVGAYAAAVMLSNGDGTFQAAVTYPVNGKPTGLAAGDFNNDGKLDLRRSKWRRHP